MVLRNGDDIVVCAEENCRNGDLPVAPAVIGDVLKPGHDVLIDDGGQLMALALIGPVYIVGRLGTGDVSTGWTSQTFNR